MSVVVARDGRDPQELIRDHPGYGLVGIPVGVLRELEQDLVPAPTPDEPDHVLVVGKKTRSRQKRMSQECIWVIEPPTFP